MRRSTNIHIIVIIIIIINLLKIEVLPQFSNTHTHARTHVTMFAESRNTLITSINTEDEHRKIHLTFSLFLSSAL